MSITATQINAVRNKSKRIFVLGKTTACTPPIKSSSNKAQTRPPGNPKSTSSWYCKANHHNHISKQINKLLRYYLSFLFWITEAQRKHIDVMGFFLVH